MFKIHTKSMTQEQVTDTRLVCQFLIFNPKKGADIKAWSLFVQVSHDVQNYKVVTDAQCGIFKNGYCSAPASSTNGSTDKTCSHHISVFVQFQRRTRPTFKRFLQYLKVVCYTKSKAGQKRRVNFMLGKCHKCEGWDVF